MSAADLEAWICSKPQSQTPEAQRVIKPQVFNEKEYDRERKAKQRAVGRELYIPVPKNIELRLACLNDFELLLTTYFPATYDEPFTEDRSDMLSSIVHAASYGGDQSIAASRGEGKTTLAMDGAMCLMLSVLSVFPVVIGKNQDSASDELKALRERMVASERFIEDFPEIGVPLEAVGASTANARLQTVGGKYIRMYLGNKFYAFPTIAIGQLPHWPKNLEPVSRGQVIGAIGIKGRVRGTKFRGGRPTVAIIDDIEDSVSASSDTVIEKNEKIIEEDIAGLSRSSKRIARVMLCTTQNRKCIAYKYTDPKQKPSWKGKRYRKMKRPPDRIDMVQQYIELRQMRKHDDPDAREAYRFWRDNKDAIEFGGEISNPYSFNKDIHSDGEPLELSAFQAYYNRVADTSADAVATEIDNDPPETVGPQGIGLTADMVASRISGLARYQLPANATALTVGLDIGKHRCHWVVTAWWRGAGGCVVDYGIAEVSGNESVRLNTQAEDIAASEPAIYRTLLNWRDELIQKEYVDATGVRRKIDMVLVDSGAYTNAAYEFVRQVRGVFNVSKGIPHYRPRAKSSDGVKAGKNQHAQWLQAANVWLYELDTDYWKAWVHERFLTPTFDDTNMLRNGSLSLYQPEGSQRHISYSQHVVAEELLTEFTEGKGSKTYWYRKNENNHWLDATYLAAACIETMGIGLIVPSEHPIAPRQVDGSQPKPKPVRKQHGQQFRNRPGGWMQGIKRR